MLMTRYLFLEISENRVPDTYYINNHPANVIKVSSIQCNAKSVEIQTTSFSNESVENADFYKPYRTK